MMLGAYTLLPAAINQLTYTLRLSAVGELPVPATQLGSITGIVTVASSSTNLIITPIIGRWIDVYGVGGYYRMFILVGCFLILGSIGGAYIVWDKKRMAAQKAKSA